MFRILRGKLQRVSARRADHPLELGDARLRRLCRLRGGRAGEHLPDRCTPVSQETAISSTSIGRPDRFRLRPSHKLDGEER